MTNQYPPELPWYAFKHNQYKGPSPNFYNPSEYQWKDKLENSFDIIHSEIITYLKNHNTKFTPYFNTDIVSTKGTWKTVTFKFWGESFNSLNDLPILNSILKTIPNITSVALSKIDGGNEITWHPGDSNTFIRCHFPITIPCGLPECGFQVNEETREWEEGKLLMFCDAHKHRAFNYSNSERIILIFDFIREDFSNQTQRIAANIISELWIQKVFLKFRFLKIMPRFIKNMIRYIYMLKSLIFNPIRL